MKNKKPDKKDEKVKPELKKNTITIQKKDYEGLVEKAKNCDEYHDKWLRAHADFENTRKRLEKEKIEFLKFANEDLILQLLPIIDNFDRAINSQKDFDKNDPHLKGIFLIKDNLHKLLEDCGVVKIKSLGEKFNPEFHEAVMVVETNEHPDGVVVDELQVGYTMHNRLIRPATVKVSKNKEELKNG